MTFAKSIVSTLRNLCLVCVDFGGDHNLNSPPKAAKIDGNFDPFWMQGGRQLPIGGLHAFNFTLLRLHERGDHCSIAMTVLASATAGRIGLVVPQDWRARD